MTQHGFDEIEVEKGRGFFIIIIIIIMIFLSFQCRMNVVRESY